MTDLRTKPAGVVRVLLPILLFEGSGAKTAPQADVPPGSVKAFTVGPNTLAVDNIDGTYYINIDGTYYITGDECIHAAASLSFATRSFNSASACSRLPIRPSASHALKKPGYCAAKRRGFDDLGWVTF